MFIFKICGRLEWEESLKSGDYLGSQDDLRDGFVHFSTSEQLDATAAKHFAGRKDLLLICYMTERIGSSLRWEPSRSGALFPHVYGSLKTSDAHWVQPLPLGPDGHIFPALKEAK